MVARVGLLCPKRGENPRSRPLIPKRVELSNPRRYVNNPSDRG